MVSQGSFYPPPFCIYLHNFLPRSDEIGRIQGGMAVDIFTFFCNHRKPAFHMDMVQTIRT